MGVSSRSWDYFHYSDSRGYLICWCHTVAKVEIVTAAKSFRLFILYQILRRFSILQAKLICLKAPSGMVGASDHINFSSIALITVANCIVGINNVFLAINLSSSVNYLGFINLAIGILGTFGCIKLLRKRKRMKQESQLFE